MIYNTDDVSDASSTSLLERQKQPLKVENNMQTIQEWKQQVEMFAFDLTLFSDQHFKFALWCRFNYSVSLNVVVYDISERFFI